MARKENITVQVKRKKNQRKRKEERKENQNREYRRELTRTHSEWDKNDEQGLCSDRG